MGKKKSKLKWYYIAILVIAVGGILIACFTGGVIDLTKLFVK